MVTRNKLDQPFQYRIKSTFNQNLSKRIRKDTSYSSKEKNLPRITLNSEHLYSKCKGMCIHIGIFTKAQSKPCTLGQFHSPLSAMDRSWKQKLNRGAMKLTEVMNQMDKQISIEHIILKENNIASSKHLLVPSLKLTI